MQPTKPSSPPTFFISLPFPPLHSSLSRTFPFSLPLSHNINNQIKKSLSPLVQILLHSFMESTKRPSFLEDDRDLPSASDMEAGYSGCNNTHYHYYQHGLVSRSTGYVTPFYRTSSRNFSVFPTRSGGFYDARFEDHQPYFLDACFLCKKPLRDDRDIFMYRGDTPFCSVECRQEQIELDEAKEKNRNLSSSMKAMRKKDQNRSTSPSKAQDYSFRTGTVAAA